MDDDDDDDDDDGFGAEIGAVRGAQRRRIARPRRMAIDNCY